MGSPCSHPNPYGGFLQWGYPKTMDFNMIYQNSLSLDTPIFGNPHISNAMLRIFAAKSPSCAPSGRSVQAAPQASLTFPSGQVGPKMKYVICIVYYIILYYIANRGLFVRLYPDSLCRSSRSSDDVTRASASALLLFSPVLQWVLSQRGQFEEPLWCWILECLIVIMYNCP